MEVRHMAMLSIGGSLAAIAVGLLSFIVLVVLRFQRRGAARAWASPAALALGVLPAALAAGVTVLSFRQTLQGLALTGSGGVAALSAGSAESLVPLLVALPVVAVLCVCGFLLVAVGSARTSEAPSALDGAGWLLLLAALAGVALTACLVAYVTFAVATFDPQAVPPSLRTRLDVALAAAGVCMLVSVVAAIGTAVRAPRSASPLGFRLASLGALTLCGLAALLGTWLVDRPFRCLSAAAMTGIACGAPPPARVETEEPPSPPGESLPDAEPSPALPEAEQTPAVPRDARPVATNVVRVGGNVPEPRRTKMVNPVYPEIARRARVQGAVVLECRIDAHGKVVSIEVLRGAPLLDQAALDAVRQWEYEPTLLNGVAVPVIMTVTVNFRLSPG